MAHMVWVARFENKDRGKTSVRKFLVQGNKGIGFRVYLFNPHILCYYMPLFPTNPQ